MTSPDSQPSFSCLVVEDCDHDYQMLERLLRRSQAPLAVRRCAHGEEVLSLLNGPDASSGGAAALPAIIILDLDLSGHRDGREVLSSIRKHPRLKRTPLVVFSASTDPDDIAWCYRQGVSAYQVKNTDLTSYQSVTDMVLRYWRCDDVPGMTTTH